ncbi:hypothetical protein F7725_024449, partial [Dissostichus mawsoni]
MVGYTPQTECAVLDEPVPNSPGRWHFTGDFWTKDELDEVVNTWNSHKIRPRSTDDTASGRPVIMYSFPELHSAEDRLKHIAMEVNLCMQECTPKGQFPCDKTVFELCCLLMAENGWDDPEDPFAAADLYILLRDEIRRQ